ncbi:hypothetical protein O1L60_27260 [Streptomyces diastatochromogenes]|nr:hypothetical protein [Streptomyces diastatochromogenes]
MSSSKTRPRRRPAMTSRRYSQRSAEPGVRRQTNRPIASSDSTSQPWSPWTASIRRSLKRSAVHVQDSARSSGSPGAGARPPSCAANAAAGPNSSSGAVPVSARWARRSSTVASICSPGTRAARSEAASSVK